MFITGDQLLLKAIITFITGIFGILVSLQMEPYTGLWLAGYCTLLLLVISGIAYENKRLLKTLTNAPEQPVQVIRKKSLPPYTLLTISYESKGQPATSQMMLTAPSTGRSRKKYSESYQHAMATIKEQQPLLVRYQPANPQHCYVSALVEQALADTHALLRGLLIFTGFMALLTLSLLSNIL